MKKIPPFPSDRKIPLPPTPEAIEPSSEGNKPSAVLKPKSNLIGGPAPSHCKIIGDGKTREKRQVIATIIRQGNIAEIGMMEI